MPTPMTRPTLVDDDGSNLVGTLVDKALLEEIFDDIDDMLTGFVILPGTLRVGAPAGPGSYHPVEFIGDADGGLSIAAPSTAAAGAVETYVVAFMKDAAPAYQKVGAMAFQWTDKNVTNGYASWNVHTSAFTGGVIADYYGLAVWAKSGAAFFPTALTSSDAPGANLVLINGALRTLASSDTSYVAARIKNSSTGTSAKTTMRWANNASDDGFHIDLNGGNFTGAANVVTLMQEFSTALAFGTNGSEVARFDVSGNFGLGVTAWGTSAAKVVGLGNGTEPSTSPADMVQLYSVDLSAGNATLGIRTETAVATETVTSDRTLSVRINGTTYKICLKA